MAELSAEELKAMGFEVPGEEAAPASLTPEQLAAMGFEVPAEPVAPAEHKVWMTPELDTFALRGAGAVPAGGLVTDLVSTALLQLAKMRGVGEPGAVLTPQAQAELYQLGASEAEVRDPGNPIPDTVDTYRRLRETRRRDTDTLSQQNPNAGRAGATVGTVASILAPLPGAKLAPLRGVPLVAGERAARILSGAVTGAGYGAVNGLTDGNADLTRGEYGAAAKETANRAAGGAVFGAAAAGAAETARPLWPRLRASAIEQGRTFLHGGSTLRAGTKRPVSDEAVQEALATGAIRPLGTVQGTLSRLQQMASTSGQEYARIVTELEARGVQGPDAQRLAEELLAKGRNVAFNTLDEGLPAVYENAASQILRKAPTPSGKLTLQQAENMKRSAQDMAHYDRLKFDTTEGAKQDVASRLRQAVEDSVETAGQDPGATKELRSLADAFRPIKAEVGRRIEARDTVESAASRAAQKNGFGLPEWGMMSSSLAAGGDPLSALATTMATKLARARVPSTLAANTYALSEGLRTGSPKMAQAITLALDPNITDTTQALIEALRRRKEQ